MILVTGASGFIASYVIERLAERGEEVTALDIKEKKFLQKNVRFVKADVRDGEAVAEIAKGCGGIIHLAAQISVQKSVEEPLYDFEVNALGTLNALEAARKNGMKRFVYSSSAAIYGKPVKIPISEEEEPAPISPYGVSKLAGERYVLNYARVHDLGAVALRIFNVYGKGQAMNDYAGVITKFKENISAGKPP
ncbi:epimerase, partial [Candidatus Micrarchaeota archaeon CG11_big_fil_rev_8_21_14_0_20_47_5]